MADKRKRATFSEPRLAINRVYTKKGDRGTTALVGGQRVPKDDARIEAYGAVDELNAAVGVAREALGSLPELEQTLERVQQELFNLGSLLATLPADLHPKQPRPTEREVAALEADMDRRNVALAPLRSFVLPGGCPANAALHVARTVCRRAERRCVTLARASEVDPLAIAYLNRLGDALFVWSRWVSRELGAAEILWDPNRSAAATAPDNRPGRSRGNR